MSSPAMTDPHLREANARPKPHLQRSAETALVVGGGIIGLCCAQQLARRGWQVTVLDEHSEMPPASWGNAGHIAVEQLEPLASWNTIRSAPRRLLGGALSVRNPLSTLPWIARFIRASSVSRFRTGCAALGSLLERALPAWRGLLAQIAHTGLIHEQGHLLVWESMQTAAKRREAWRSSPAGGCVIEDLTTAELTGLSADWQRSPVAGIRFSGTAQVADPGLLVAALRQALEAAGGQVLKGTAEALSLEGNRAAVHSTSGRRWCPDLVLVAAGIGSASLLAGLGRRPPLIAERGYHLQWAEHDWPESVPPVVFEDRAMIVTRFQSGLRAAGFVEFAHPATKPDSRKWQMLARHVRELGLPVRGEPRPWFGARPTLPDYLPAIGRSIRADNLLYAFGHQHLGLTLAALTAELIGALAVGEIPELPLQAFDLERFN